MKKNATFITINPTLAKWVYEQLQNVPTDLNLGLTQLPALYFIYLFVIVILYMLLISFAKYFYIAKYKKLI